MAAATTSPEVILLSFNADKVTNNWSRWLPVAYSKMNQKFKRQASVMKTPFKKYVPSITAPAEGRKGITDQKFLDMLDGEYLKMRQKTIYDLEESAEAFMLALLDLLAPSAQTLMESHGLYDEIHGAGDPNRMFGIIREMFFTKVGGTGQNKVAMKMAVDGKWALFKQLPEWDVDYYHTQMKDWMDIRAAWEMAALSDEEQGYCFITRLDSARFSKMQTDYKNGSILESTYPKTLYKAQLVASQYVIEPTAAAAGKNSSSTSLEERTYTLCGTVNSKPNAQQRDAMTRAPGGGGVRVRRVRGDVRDSDAELQCHKCLEIGHISVNCEDAHAGRPLPAGKSPTRQATTKKKANARQTASTGGPPNTLKGPRPAAPAVKETFVAQGEEDDGSDDEEALYSHAFSHVRRNCVAIEVQDPVFSLTESVYGFWLSFLRLTLFICSIFSQLATSADTYEDSEREIRSVLLADAGMIEITLDSAASHSLFTCADAITDLVPKRRSYTMKGIERDSKGIRVTSQGTFEDLGLVDVCLDAVANVLSQGELVDKGYKVSLDSGTDQYCVQGGSRKWVFARKVLRNGMKSRFYTHDLALSPRRAFIHTVGENKTDFSVREVRQAEGAVQLAARLGHMTPAAVIATLNGGLLNCDITPSDVRNGQAIFGKDSVASLKGRTKKRVSFPLSRDVAPRVVQEQQTLSVDIMFVDSLAFLIGVLSPLELCLGVFLRDRNTSTIAKGLRSFIGTANSRNFDVVRLHSDREGGVAALRDELALTEGLLLDLTGPGQHAPTVERMNQSVKQRVRAHQFSVAWVMNRALLIGCVMFSIWCVNLQRSATSVDPASPHEKFSGVKLDFARDLRCEYGEYCQATVPETNNTMAARTVGCICMGSAGNLTGSVRMYSIETGSVFVRDQFTLLPTPDHVTAILTASARKDGLVGRVDNVTKNTAAKGDILHEVVRAVELSEQPVVRQAVAPALPLDTGVVGLQPTVTTAPIIAAAPDMCPAEDYGELRRSSRSNLGQAPVRFDEVSYHIAELMMADETRSLLMQQLHHRRNWHDQQFVFKMSVRAALRERGEEARPVIMAELQQMIDKGVWRAIRTSSLTRAQYGAVIRSSMFLKDKYLASGEFEKFKARLVAGGDQQDRGLYDNLSSPTAATSSVLSIAAIAAAEHRFVMVVDIGGAFLNASMKSTGVPVHMRLDRIMTKMLVELHPQYAPYVEESGCMVVVLDKALYGCVEASSLWYAHLRGTLLADGFVENAYDMCVFNKFAADGAQITVVLHVDDLMVTSTSQTALSVFDAYLKGVYAETKTKRGLLIDYLGMSFDFRVKGEVSITMENCVDEILSECGVAIENRATPATLTLFDVRDMPKATAAESKWFHSNVAKLLYLAKRVRPECLTTVSFLSTRVQACDQDDVSKLKRLLGYVLATRERGITLRIGESMTVSAYIDAAYGVHSESGKSHTGCAIVLGDAGPLFAKSGKQRIVTKSSTEAELVGLSDTASQAIHLRNFIGAQGYDMGPAVIYQDNLSCMALMKRGGPSSERSRHIDIRHFWLKERVDGKEVIIEHLGTEDMFANILTKPVQGAQFEKERHGLTNWSGVPARQR